MANQVPDAVLIARMQHRLVSLEYRLVAKGDDVLAREVNAVLNILDQIARQ